VHLQLAPVRADELAERLLVADPGPVNQVRAHGTAPFTAWPLSSY